MPDSDFTVSYVYLAQSSCTLTSPSINRGIVFKSGESGAFKTIQRLESTNW